jgi:hypothetical protein
MRSLLMALAVVAAASTGAAAQAPVRDANPRAAVAPRPEAVPARILAGARGREVLGRAKEGPAAVRTPAAAVPRRPAKPASSRRD